MLPSIEDEFEHLGVVRGGILFLSATNALTVLEQCRIRGIGVLGIDGFRVSDKGTQPVQEHSLDLSGVHKPQTRWATLERFLSERLTSGLHFELVMDDA